MTHRPTRRHLLWLAGAPWLLGQAGCGSRPGLQGADPSLVASLAPGGRLRASINLGNPILARRDAAISVVSGVSVGLALTLAAQLGVTAELIVVEAAARSVAAVLASAADIGFFAIDPQRAGGGIHFSAPYGRVHAGGWFGLVADFAALPECSRSCV